MSDEILYQGECGDLLDKIERLRAELDEKDKRIEELEQLLSEFSFRVSVKPIMNESTWAHHYWGPDPKSIEEALTGGER